MKKAVLSLSVISALASISTQAQDDSSVYIGGRVGASVLKNTCTIEHCDNTNVAAGAILGYDFNKMFAIEGTYDYLGNNTTNTNIFKPATGDLTAFTLAPKVSFGLSDRTRVYGKLGAAWWMFDTNTGALDDITYMGALGVDHRATDNINIRFEYQYMDIDKKAAVYDFEANSHLFTAGLTYHFGRTPMAGVVPDTSLDNDIVDDFQPAPSVNEILVPELFSSVQFAFDRSEIDSEAINLLQPVLQRLQDVPESTVVVSGYTDSIGSEAFNEILSLERAKSVAQFFATNGIDPRRMIIQGLGESSPVASNQTNEGRQMNRRVEVYSPELIVIEQ